jgi:hypothetical protein
VDTFPRPLHVPLYRGSAARTVVIFRLQIRAKDPARALQVRPGLASTDAAYDSVSASTSACACATISAAVLPLAVPADAPLELRMTSMSKMSPFLPSSSPNV